MAISTEPPRPSGLAVAEPRRAGRELLLEWIFQPLSGLVVPALARLRVPPPAVVLANAAVGLFSAVALAADELIVGALLLQAKTLLDNCDGRLARASGRVTLAGRYLDTIADLFVNAALFVALARITGKPLLAAAAFVALTLVLAVDFNLSELAREAHGITADVVRSTGSRIERLLAGAYAVVFAPQDRLVRAVSERRFERAVGARRTQGAQHAYFDSFTLSALANLGLTTQLAVLGLCLVLGAPTVYLWLAVGAFLSLVPLQLRREGLARRAAVR